MPNFLSGKIFLGERGKLGAEKIIPQKERKKIPALRKGKAGIFLQCAQHGRNLNDVKQ